VLPGVTRAVVLELARDFGIPSVEAAMPVSELFAASEVFLAGTTNDVLPITSVDGRAIGTGHPGAVAERLFQGLRARMDAVPQRSGSKDSSRTFASGRSGLEK
jgi:branched-subunit amino acid aminotransferase/4-amino-4-deoxychorismate lyase